MDSQPEPLPNLSKANGKTSHLSPQIRSLGNIDEEKWNLSWFASVAQRRALLMAQVAIGTTLVGGGLLLLLSYSKTPKYAGKFQLLVEPITAEEQLTRSSSIAQGSDEPSVQRINVEQSSLDYESQIRILLGPKLLEPAIEKIRKKYPEVSYEILSKNLKIARITTLTLDKKEQGTKLIEVTYQDTNPEKVKLVLEQLSDSYLYYSLKERQSTIRRGIQFIDSQLTPLRQRVDSLQQQIQTLRQQYKIVDPEQQGKQLTETAGKLNQIEVENRTLLAEAEAKRDALERQLRDASPQSVLGETSYYRALLDQYQELEGQFAIEAARLNPGHPAIVALQDKRQNLQNLLNQEANRVVKKADDAIIVAESRSQAISQGQGEINQKIQQLAQFTRQYSDLQRELTLATDSLNKFAARQGALQIDAAQQEIPWELTIPPMLELDESGQPMKVNSLSKVRFLALIAVLGVLLGAGVGFLVETTQDVLHTTDDAKRATQLPLLGVIPHSDSLSQTVSELATESFRSLAKNIRLLGKTYAPIRSLAIVSAEAGDGKSTIALHLAMTAATMGQRVLLVDADFHRPKVHELLGLSNQQGLSNLLLGDQDIPKNVFQSLPICRNLAILTAGKPPFDPVELFTTKQFETLFQKLQAMFDLVIYDTPPLIGLADSALVAAQCDSLALVVRLGKTSRSSILAALEELNFSTTSVLGTIANDAPKTASLIQSHYLIE
jgi:polysaccharide biosynthesis transport protein